MVEPTAALAISIMPGHQSDTRGSINLASGVGITRAAVRVVHLDAGLYAVKVADTGGTMPAPLRSGELLTQVSMLPPSGSVNTRIVGGKAGDITWLGRGGGTVVVMAPPGGGDLYVTSYSDDTGSVRLPELEVRAFDRRRDIAASEGSEIKTEVVVHVEREGDCRFPGGAWAGTVGGHLRIEGFSIRPLEAIAARDIEFRGFGPAGAETPWVTDARLCGTRGRALPLTGFAIRVAGRLAGRFDISYRGSFFESGIVGPCRDGEVCRSTARADDPLEAIEVRLARR